MSGNLLSMATVAQPHPQPQPRALPVAWGTAVRATAAALVCVAAPALFALQGLPWGFVPLAVGVAAGLLVDRALGRDLAILSAGLVPLALVPLHADLSNAGIAKFSLALGAAVVLPFVLLRYVRRERPLARHPGGWRWSGRRWAYLAGVVALSYLVLPVYFTASGAYLNWPTIATGDDMARLFVGVNLVGVWNELFFIATVFMLLRRHFPLWVANVLQAAVFVSFLWELGYREWGPVFTVPFALLQGWIYARTKSLPYVVTMHLLFDAVVFAALVHAYNPGLFDIFVTSR